jgi:hypothetical protein
MPLSEPHARIAMVVWALSWLPGLALASWRAERLIRAERRWRALTEYAALLAVPLASFGGYALAGAQRYAEARGGPVGWGSLLLSIAQVAVPYAVSAACLLLPRRSNTGPSVPARWWIGLLLGLLAVLVLVPGLLMAQLMVFVGT